MRDLERDNIAEAEGRQSDDSAKHDEVAFLGLALGHLETATAIMARQAHARNVAGRHPAFVVIIVGWAVDSGAGVGAATHKNRIGRLVRRPLDGGDRCAVGRDNECAQVPRRDVVGRDVYHGDQIPLQVEDPLGGREYVKRRRREHAGWFSVAPLYVRRAGRIEDEALDGGAESTERPGWISDSGRRWSGHDHLDL
eukprot:scaffold80990_cov52-Phaeocystis_antarctica.AAC.2